MRRLPLVLIPLIILVKVITLGARHSDSPHGNSLKISCDVCHTSSGWIMDENSTFDHSSTNFLLHGQHLNVACRNCHPTLVFNDAGNQCNDCHTDIHEQSLGTACDRCHTEQSWLVTNVQEMHAQTRFPLMGAHSIADCDACHVSTSGLRFDPLSIACFSCHSEDYFATTSPNHSSANYSYDCEECHNIFSYQWQASGINHSFFPLAGGHEISDCFLCHEQGNYSNISAVCSSCHLDDYTATTNPSHSGAGFSMECESCHDYMLGWSPANFDHNQFFSLSGVHNIDDCAACHVSGHYGDASSECYSCHASDYNATENPVHSDAGFSTDCSQCHSTISGWIPATFDHTIFPLTGVHDISDCLQCHESGNYAIVSSLCFSCHEDDYNSTTDPNHLASGFSTSCEICHSTTTGWVPSTFDHDSYFPIYSGTHREEWNSCSDCHTNNSNYSVFSCTDCHEHNRTDTDEDHSEVNDYIYESNACLSCHPTGND